MSGPSSSPHSPFSTLRQFARAGVAVELCELCSAGLASNHQHLIDPATRQLLCCCDACAILFSTPAQTLYRRVPRRIQFLQHFQMTDAQWEQLLIPINLTFFFKSTPADRVIALYPSPAGATESLLSLEAWNELVQNNPILADLEPDVEALLVNRVSHPPEYFRVPIDECYKLVGLIRIHWRGLSGGSQVWQEINQFFAHLKEE